MEYNKLIETRRSNYTLENKAVVKDEELIKELEKVIKNAPTAFNSQATHIIVALGKKHELVWDITHDTLEKIAPPERFKTTASKLAMFKGGYGTILVFKDEKKIDDLKKAFPSFANRQDGWGEQNIGILVYGLWLALYNLGYSGNIQHYDPLIDDKIKEEFKVPEDWKLETEMVFGKAKAEAGEKPFDDINTRIQVAK